MIKDEKFKIKDISKKLHLNRKTVRNIIKNIENNIPFELASNKLKKTCQIRNLNYSEVDQSIYNTILCNNSCVIKEIKAEVCQKTGVDLSESSISRKIKRMNITRKRLSKVPIERNTIENINRRAKYASDVTKISDLILQN